MGQMMESKETRVFSKTHMGVSKNRGKTPKMDGENNGKPENPIKMDHLFGGTTILGNTHILTGVIQWNPFWFGIKLHDVFQKNCGLSCQK